MPMIIGPEIYYDAFKLRYYDSDFENNALQLLRHYKTDSLKRLRGNFNVLSKIGLRN